jgi:hypothetical protein
MHHFDPMLDEYEDEPFAEWKDEVLESGDAGEEEEGEWDHDEDEAMELEFATRLLDVGGEDEIERFVADLVHSTVGGRAGFAHAREGRQISGILHQAARKVQPILSRGRDRPIGWGTGNELVDPVVPAAKRYFGVSLEGLSPEDQEFEFARSFVRFARKAIGETERRSGTGPPGRVAHHAAMETAEQLAPGLIGDEKTDAGWPKGPARGLAVRSEPFQAAQVAGRTDRCHVCGANLGVISGNQR